MVFIKTVLYKDDILRCISQSRRIKQTWKIRFLEKLEMES